MKRDRGFLRFMPARRAVSSMLNERILFAALRALNSALRRDLDACAAYGKAGLCGDNSFYCPSGTEFRPPAEFGTPARRAARRGRLWGYAPFSAPPCIPPRSTPKRVFRFHKTTRATRHLLRELPSLATLAQVISLRAALMPEETFALNVSPLQPNAYGFFDN